MYHNFTFVQKKIKAMNIIRKAIKRYKVRRMRRKLENQVIEPAYSIVCYREDGKAEIWMIL